MYAGRMFHTPLNGLLVSLVLLSSLPAYSIRHALASETPVDADVPIIPERPESVADSAGGGVVTRVTEYIAEFQLFDRSILGRAPPGVTSLVNNEEKSMNVEPGTLQAFIFEKSTIFARLNQQEARQRIELRAQNAEHQEEGRDLGLELRDTVPRSSEGLAKRQATKTVFISANTCQQPQLLPQADATQLEAPQLTLFVSTSSNNKAPGPMANAAQQVFHVFNEGAVMINVDATDDVFFSIAAPNVSTAFSSRTYSVNVAASVDEFYHSYSDTTPSELSFVDSDGRGALLVTRAVADGSDENMIEQLMSRQPYVLFAHQEGDETINGVRYSYCGLQNYAQMAGTKNGRSTNMIQTDMTRRGLGNLPRQQFSVSGLNASSRYVGILAANGKAGLSGNGMVGGGGHVSRATVFQTKAAGDSCALVQNLAFCDQVAYSAPANPTKFNSTQLATFYDNYTQSMWNNFQKVLAQMACETESTQRYSLARNCSDCEAAYKTWLCSVAIPRCEEFSATEDFLQVRAVDNPFADGTTLPPEVIASFPNSPAYKGSRNAKIDEGLQPGPYKELLPCDDLCYHVVQSCPHGMELSCPMPGVPGYNTSYRPRERGGPLKCHFPESAKRFSGAAREPLSWAVLAGMSSLVVFFLL